MPFEREDLFTRLNFLCSPSMLNEITNICLICKFGLNGPLAEGEATVKRYLIGSTKIINIGAGCGQQTV